VRETVDIASWEALEEFLGQHCVPSATICDSTIQMADIEQLETLTVATVMIRILGNHSLHKVSGGKMLLVERVQVVTYFGWGQMLLTVLKHQLSSCRRASRGNCAFGTVLCVFFFERIPTLHPHVHIRDWGGT
jgi:hypothetical protein